MKHLFFVAVAVGIFSGTSNTAQAQANVNLEHVAEKSKTKPTPKFIENIEISPLGGYDAQDVNERKVTGTSTNSIAEDVEYNIKSTSYTGTYRNTSIKTKVFATTIENCAGLQFKYAMMMDMEVEAVSNMPLYNFIDEWWATRYQYGGTDKTGIDCSAFTGKLLATVFNANVPRTAKDQYDATDRVDLEDLQEGDLVFFNTRGGVSHVGLYLGNNYFVHSSTSNGVSISSLTDDYYSRKFIGGGRVKK